MTTMTEQSTREMCQEHALHIETMLDDLWLAVDSGTEYEDADPMEYLDEMPLEIVWEKGEPFAIVLGTGGPHIEIRGGSRHDGQSYAVHVYWSGEHVIHGRGSESVQRTGEYFRELVEQG